MYRRRPGPSLYRINIGRIYIKLPRFKPMQTYQLIHIGSIYHTKNKDHFEVEIFFKLMQGKDYWQVASDKIFIQKVDVRSFPLLIIGSLWCPYGLQKLNVEYLYPSVREFEIIGNQNTLKLRDILTGSHNLNKFLSGISWQDALESSYTITVLNNEKIITPCTELMRALYYRQADLVNLFFSRARIRSYGQVLQYPDELNNRHAIIQNFINVSEYFVLAELLINNEFLKQARISHSELFIQMRSQIPSSGKLVHNPVPCKILANGFEFIDGEDKFFMVCRIDDVNNLFSYSTMYNL